MKEFIIQGNYKWKWVNDEKLGICFGTSSGEKDYWELRVYDRHPAKWEAWNYQESNPIKTSYGVEDTFDKALLSAMNYVKEIESR